MNKSDERTPSCLRRRSAITLTHGVLKKAIDCVWCPPNHPSTGKAVGTLSCSAGTSGTMRAQYHLRQVMIFLDMRPINKPEVFLPGAGNLLDTNGNLTDGATEERLTELITALAAWSKQLA